MPFSQTYPPAAPTITGDTITVAIWLADVPRVARVLNDLAQQRYISGRIFATGPRATGGAIIFDQVTTTDLFLGRDVEVIAPAQDFPILTDTAPTPLTAAVAKWGGRVFVSDEARDRNRMDVLRREMTKLSNTLVRKVDTVSIAALDAAPINTLAAGTAWSAATAAQMIANLVDASVLVNGPDMGYALDLMLLNPTNFAQLLKNADFRNAMQAASPTSLLREGIIGTFMGMEFGQTNRVAAGTAYGVQQGMIGGISDEVPPTTEVYREPGKQATFVQSDRRFVAYVTDPKAAVKITGL